MPEPKTTTIRKALEALCDQLPPGANCNPAARILKACNDIDEKLETMECKIENVGYTYGD
jgi:hypothetical protein